MCVVLIGVIIDQTFMFSMCNMMIFLCSDPCIYHKQILSVVSDPVKGFLRLWRTELYYFSQNWKEKSRTH